MVGASSLRRLLSALNLPRLADLALPEPRLGELVLRECITCESFIVETSSGC